MSTPEEAEERVARDILLRNRGNISKVKDPLPLALYVLARANMEDLIVLYNLPAVPTGDLDAFLASLAKKEGALQKKVRSGLSTPSLALIWIYRLIIP